MTVRLHANRCYPEQGGLYYRYNNTIEYGEQENEIVGTRATNMDGFLDFQIKRPWEMEVGDEQSIVITSASEGILLCMNLNWTRVDGAFSSAVGMVSLLAALGMVMKQMFFFSVYSNKHFSIGEKILIIHPIFGQLYQLMAYLANLESLESLKSLVEVIFTTIL